MRIGVLPLPGVLEGISQLVELHDGVCGIVGLQRDQRPVVVKPECHHLAHVLRLGILPAQRGRLFPGHVVDHMGREPVRSVAGRVSAQHIGPSRRRLLPDFYLSRRIVRPAVCTRAGLRSRLPVPHKASPPDRLRRSLHALDHQVVFEYADARVPERLLRTGGVLPAKGVLPAAAVVGDAPSAPLQLRLRKGIELRHPPFLRGPLRPRDRLHGVLRVLEPGEEYGLKVVFPRRSRLPTLLEVLVSVGRGLYDHHGGRIGGHGLQDPGKRFRLSRPGRRPEGVFG